MANVIFTVGNSMMGDDGAGPLLADLLTRTPAQDWVVIDGGSAPENHVDQVLAHQPRRVIVFDAAEMGARHGAVHTVDPRMIADMFFMTTHNMPLSFMIDRIRETGVDVDFVGIQPAVVAFSFPMMDVVRQGVEAVHAHLCSGTPLPEFAPLLTEDALI
ncbi:MAG: hycI [Burkholderiaceae bacterium]|nr:hycI [Burkholderiaceae bacterium]